MNGSAVSNSMPFSTVCEVNTELLIPASPEEVWDVFGDFANWGTWNDFMVLPIAPSKVGQHCKVEFCLEGGCIRRSIHSPEVCHRLGTIEQWLHAHCHKLRQAFSSTAASMPHMRTS